MEPTAAAAAAAAADLAAAPAAAPAEDDADAISDFPAKDLEFVGYTSELQMPPIVALIERDLSEPYSVFTYRYFINNWPNLCFLAMADGECVGTIVCKLDAHGRERVTHRGYIAMLAVRKDFRKKGIGEPHRQTGRAPLPTPSAFCAPFRLEVAPHPTPERSHRSPPIQDRRWSSRRWTRCARRTRTSACWRQS